MDEAFDAIEGTLQHGYPITYEAVGRQFIAVPASLGSAFRSLTAQLTPEIYQPEGGNAIYVFALPQERPGERRQDAAPATPRCRTAALLFCEGKEERDPFLRADPPCDVALTINVFEQNDMTGMEPDRRAVSDLQFLLSREGNVVVAA